MAFPPQITSTPQAQAEVIVNEALGTLEHQAVYGKKPTTTAGLVWGYYGGRWGGIAVADGTLTLDASQTVYGVVERATGAFTKSTSNTNWNNTAAYARVYKWTTAAAAVTTVEDYRGGQHGVHGGGGSSTVVAGLVVYKGAVDCSANPNYPAADAGHLYIVSVAGKIGGASGVVVEAGDLFLCKTDGTASGNHATVGAQWDVIQTNVVDAASTSYVTSAIAAAIAGISTGGGVRAVTGTSDTIVTADRGKLVSYSNAAAVAVSLPQAGSTGINNVWFTYVVNLGVGTATITPTTSTINGAATLALTTGQGALIFSDGTNWVAIKTGASSGGGGSGGAFTYASSAPSSPTAGDRWVDADTGVLFTWINDGTTSQWVEF